MQKSILRLIIAVILVALPAVFYVSCTRVQPNSKPVITVSILPHKYIAGRIAGDRFIVQVLTPPGANHETFEPTPRQIAALSSSRMVFINGYLLFEDNLVKKFAKTGDLKMVDLSKGVNLISGDVVEHGDHVHMYGVDPHFWLSPVEVKVMATSITKSLIEIDPQGEEVFLQNLAELIADIEKLDNDIKDAFSNLRIKTFLIYHPALAYFARDYGLNQVALEMDGKEPTLGQLKDITDLAKKEEIRTIFIQKQFSSSSTEALAREIGGKVIAIDPVPENWLETMYDMTQALQKAMQ